VQRTRYLILLVNYLQPARFANDLYPNPAHFLMELLQNADDNSYEIPTPMVKFSYTRAKGVKGKLRIDCNEVGFSKVNVDAICGIGNSTKSGVGGGARYIGEKGIGFKSVFKCADIAWISSGPYSFNFDKSRHLGIITPLWASFPETRLPEFSSILLELSGDCEVDEVIQALKGLDPGVLLFLRNLKEIHIEVVDDKESVWKNTLTLDHVPRAIIKQQDYVGSGSNRSLVRLQSHNKSLSYALFKQVVSNLPVDSRRECCQESELVLAFPWNDSDELDSESQNVYAFLPIRDYGLKVCPLLKKLICLSQILRILHSV
jgi:hypothetical protein